MYRVNLSSVPLHLADRNRTTSQRLLRRGGGMTWQYPTMEDTEKRGRGGKRDTSTVLIDRVILEPGASPTA